MLPFLDLFGFPLPSYGVCIVLGCVAAGLLTLPLLRKYGQDMTHFIVLCAYTLLGAMAGAKLLFLWTARDLIQWQYIFVPEYLDLLMSSGFVFYGGFLGGLGLFLLAGKIHHIDTGFYFRKLGFTVPLAHAFGRVGCFLAGCCYGVPYSGPLAVVFPDTGEAPPGVPLFPVQLLEAALLLALAAFLYFRYARGDRKANSFIVYVLLYGVIRFFTEFFRGDGVRGSLGPLSTSQWIALAAVAAAAAYLLIRRKRAPAGEAE